MTEEIQIEKNKFKAVASIMTAFLFLAMISVLMKLMITNKATIEWAVFMQFSTGLVIMFFVVLRNGFGILKTTKLKYHLVRGIGGVIAFGFTGLAISKIPLVNASLLNNTAPIFIPIITLIWLRKKFDRKIWWGILIGFTGIIFILNPKESDLLKSGDIYGILAGISLGIAYVALGVLTKTEAFISIVFYYALIAAAISFPFAVLNWSNPPLKIWLLSVLSGILFVAYSFLLQYAYKYGEAVKLSPFNFSVVVFTGIFDWLLFGHIPGLFALIGIVLVSAGGVLSIVLHEKDNKALKHNWH